MYDRCTHMRKFTLLLALITIACGGTFEEAKNPNVAVGAPPQSERCAELDDRAAFYGGAGKGAAVLAGGSGLATIATDDKTARMVLAISSASMGAIAAGAGWVSSSASTSWARECSQ